MRVTWNGTGSAWATHYGNSSAVVEAEGQRLLIDCGHTVPGRLRQMNIGLRDIDAIFISHLHGDHCYGLEEWGFRSFFQWGIKPRLLVPHDLSVPLWRQVLAGTMAVTCDGNCLLRDYFVVTPLHVDQPYDLGPFTLEIHPVRHVLHALAYGVKVRAKGACAAFTCDTLADADPWFYADSAQVFHDCSFTPYFPKTVHSHFDELCAYPESFRKKTMLVHYDDDLQTQRLVPDFQSRLAATGMRLTEPFVPIEIPAACLPCQEDR